MSQGKFLSLEEARKLGKLKEFGKQHPAEGDADTFDRLFDKMASGEQPPEKDKQPK